MRRVAVVEGHPVAAIGLRVLVEAEPGLQLHGVHVDDDSLITGLRLSPAEVAVIDVDQGVGQLSASALIGKLKAEWPALDVIVLSSVIKTSAHEYVAAGARAVLDKATSPTVLLAYLSGSAREN